MKNVLPFSWLPTHAQRSSGPCLDCCISSHHDSYVPMRISLKEQGATPDNASPIRVSWNWLHMRIFATQMTLYRSQENGLFSTSSAIIAP
ncbi:hypothetical protein [Absidia glauca]|uniref:Uncharacterized protein n=1 Tax=Absidia glauca TaxID=4829 RepID=A0A168KIX6_ABSGL|nr:hypothetical protein [Absidia glauca]